MEAYVYIYVCIYTHTHAAQLFAYVSIEENKMHEAVFLATLKVKRR